MTLDEMKKKKLLRFMIYIWLGLIVVLVYATMYARQQAANNNVIVPTLYHPQ